MKKRLVKTSFRSSHHSLHIITDWPINLQISPNPLTKDAFKKYMNPIFIAPRSTELTVCVLCDLPMTSLQHITCIYSISQNQPAKNFDPHYATRLPKAIYKPPELGCAYKYICRICLLHKLPPQTNDQESF
jgi:hypothetical protein